MIVRIDTPGTDHAALGQGTTVKASDGQEIRGVRAIDIRVRGNEPIVAKVELFCAFHGVAKALFQVCPPLGGELKTVKRIEFADGTVWNADTPA